MGAVKLNLGPLAPSIGGQLRSQGLRVVDEHHLECARSAVTTLYVAGYLTEAEAKKARKRIADQVFALAERIAAPSLPAPSLSREEAGTR